MSCSATSLSKPPSLRKCTRHMHEIRDSQLEENSGGMMVFRLLVSSDKVRVKSSGAWGIAGGLQMICTGAAWALKAPGNYRPSGRSTTVRRP